MYYSALVPCLFASFIGAGIAGKLGLAPESFPVSEIPAMSISGAVFAVILAMVCACAGILLCVSLHNSGKLAQKLVPNPYLRVLAGSAIFIVLTLIFKERYYNGGGMQLIERCFEGESVPVYAFLMKIVFTSIALSAGFKGGEIARYRAREVRRRARGAQRPALYLRQAGNARLASRARGHRAPAGTHARGGLGAV